jgi:hypothetical protein
MTVLVIVLIAAVLGFAFYVFAGSMSHNRRDTDSCRNDPAYEGDGNVVSSLEDDGGDGDHA